MVKKNRLLKIYLVYSLVISQFLVVVVIIGASYIPAISGVLRILGIIAAVLAPAGVYIFYRWIKKDNEASSDELEQLVLTKAFALSGFVAISLTPVLMLLSFLFSSAAVFIAFGYLVIIGGTLKMATYYYYRKY